MLTKLKNLIFSTFMKRVAVAALILLGFPAFVVLGPQLHERYIYGTVGSQIVRIVSPTQHGSGGTGFAVVAPSGDKYTITNRHVCQLAENGAVDATFPGDQERYFRLNVREVSRTTDLCILDPVPALRGAHIADALSPGDEVGIVGHPLLQTATLSRGMLTSFETITLLSFVNIPQEQCEYYHGEYKEAPPMLKLFAGIDSGCFTPIRSGRTTATIYPGNSGSPVVNFFGNVVGVAFAGDNETHFGYIIPLADLKELLSRY